MSRLAKVILMITAALAAVILLSAKPVGNFLGNKFASTIVNVGQGKISHPAGFVSGRIAEMGSLLALAAILAFFYLVVRRLIAARTHAWVLLALCAFAAVNLWLLAATQTGLFWASLYTGSATSNFTQFNFKKHLLKEHRTPRQVLLLGSSQTQSQFDENTLNQQLQGQAWVTELHFPGSRALDLLLVLRRLRGQPGDDLVCYLSEYYFYSGLHSTTPPVFLSAADLSLLRRLGWGGELLTQTFFSGLVGEVVPLFACREPLAHRVFGIAMSSLEQVRHDSGLETNLVQRAGTAAEIFQLDGRAALQKRTIEEFVQEAARQNRRLVLLEGQVNPLLAARIPPAIRADLKAFLRRVAADHPHVKLVSEGEMPPQSQEAYDDLTHVSPGTQREFSLWFAAYFERELSRKLAGLK
jgi:hypothetical protein